jgi:hypothetical protein
MDNMLYSVSLILCALGGIMALMSLTTLRGE